MWTDEQKLAIDMSVSDILVTAAAGSGKTAVMVERLINRIISPDGCDIDKILVVTFTKAAAAEIKERIASKIAEKLETEGSTRLKTQLVLINRASICTIHSFCLEILKNNFHLLDLDPNFKVGDASELNILRAKALDDVFDKHYESEDADFLRLVNSFTRKTDDALAEIVMNIYNFSQSTPEPHKFLDKCTDVYSGNFSAHTDYILDNVCRDATYGAKLYKKALELCQFDTAFDKCREIVSDELALCENILKLKDEGWDRIYDYIKDYKFAIMRSNKNMDATAYEQLKLLRDNARSVLKNIMAHMVYMPLSAIAKDLEYMKPCVLKLCDLVKEFSKTYSEYKKEKGLVDFNDFEHLALKLLTDKSHPEVAQSLKNRYEEIYVDEYQDCNGVQEAIFKAVSRESYGKPNMFMVGDMKQCIYRFRNANPQLFKFKSDTYGHGDYKKIVLNKNFRSRNTILQGTNMVFSNIMSEDVGELDYTEEEYLYYGADYYENRNPDTTCIDISIVDASGEFEDTDEEKPAKIEAEATMVAEKIREMIDRGYVVFDKEKKEYRPLKYRDVAILLRSRVGSGEYFLDALSRHSIPAFCDTGAGYFECEEVSFLISFIKVIANPLDDINLVSVLRSGIYNFTDNELLKIRTEQTEGYYYDSLLKYSLKKDSLSAKVSAFLNKLSKYVKLSAVMRTDEFLWYVIEETDYMNYIGTQKNPDTKKSNVRMFISRAGMFDKNVGGGISKFADYVTEISMSGGGGNEAKLIGENDDVVRIMTIHKSKGLEFPVVFVSQCGKKFMIRDLSSPVLMHHKFGLGIDYVDEKKRFSYKPVVKDAIKDKCMSENLSEEMRLLYVAMTRAREKLIITGVVDDYEKFLEKLNLFVTDKNGKPDEKTVSTCRTYLEWIMASVSDDGIFKKSIHSIYSLSDSAIEEENVQIRLPKKDPYSPYKPEILRRLSWEYPYKSLSDLPRNVTVTEIKRLHDEDKENVFRLYRMPQLKKPKLISGETGIDYASYGTLMHLCMEKIELTEGKNHDTIKEEIMSFAKKGIIAEEKVKYIDIDAISGFFQSPLGKAMVKSTDIHREAPFEILVDAGEIFSKCSFDEKIVVQGMIDAYFTDSEGNLILVDYKTDRRGDLPFEDFKKSICERYRMQMYYYDKAIRLFTGRSVHKRYIYLFDIGEAIEVVI